MPFSNSIYNFNYHRNIIFYPDIYNTKRKIWYNRIFWIKKKFIIKSYGKEDIEVDATESVLEEKGIKIPLKNFLDGLIKNPISIPNTYQRIDEKNNNLFSLFIYPIKGLIDSSGICFFLFVLGGTINLLIEMNSLTNGIAALGRVTKGKEFILLILIFLIISIGGLLMEWWRKLYPSTQY